MVRPVTAIVGGTVIDGTGSAPTRKVTILIEDSRISRIGQSDQIGIPDGAKIIKAKDCVVMPGLIDCHTHICEESTSPSLVSAGSLEFSVMDKAVIAVASAKRLIESGITSIRDMGSPGHIDIAVRDAINRGIIAGPRIFASDEGITITGGHMDEFKSIRSLVFEGLSLGNRFADGVTECLKTVRKQIRVGADQIKIWATGGVMDKRTGTQEFSNEEIKTVVMETKRLGKFVAAHAVSSESIKFCSEIGVRSVEHGIFSDEECIETMAQKGTYLVPTLIAYQLMAGDKFPQETQDTAKKAVFAHGRTLKMAKEAGVKIAMGTDSGAPYGNTHGECQAWELELMVKRGLTEMESIVAATRTAAECIGIGDRTGTLEQGKLADLIIIEGDPLENIRVFQDKNRIKMVMKEGITCVLRP